MPIVELNGLKMHYEIEGEGIPLLLLHGFTGIGTDWKLIFREPLAGYQMIMPDLRGHGLSTNPSEQFTFREAASDIFALLEQLEIKTIKAVGMSGGAQVLLHLATLHPSRIAAMVLVSAAPYFPGPARSLMAKFTLEGISETEWTTLRMRHKYGDDQIKALWRQGNALKDSFHDVNFSVKDLAKITARTLVVHGDQDPFYPVEIARELHQQISNSSMWIIPNGGHCPIFGALTHKFSDKALTHLQD